MINDPIFEFLANHHGVISRREASELDLSESAIQRRVTSGVWRRVGYGVYMVSSAPTTWMSEARSIALAARGVISHRAAARVWKIDGFDRERTEITVRKGGSGRREREDGFRVHESKQFDRIAKREIDGVLVTGIARTVLDIAAVVGRDRLERTIDAVLRQGLLDWSELEAVLGKHSAHGRDGCGRLRALMEERVGPAAIPQTNWNRKVGQLLVRAGLPTPKYEYVVLDPQDGGFIGQVDLAYPEKKLVIECDSEKWHLNRKSFRNDPRRKNALLVAGWRVLTFTWTDFRSAPEQLVRTVRATLRAR